MNCPLFIDYSRECMKEIGVLPIDTLEYCMTDKYAGCPFYKVYNNLGTICTNTRNCPVYIRFKAKDFEKLVEITRLHCLSENYANCARYLLKAKGEVVSEDLLPDGRMLED